EEWRSTDLSQLTRLRLRPAARPPVLSPTGIESCIVPEAGARLVFVDGTFAPELSASTAETAVRVLSLAAALKTEARTLEPHLAQLASFERNVFTALNTAHLRDAAVVIVGPGAACEKPVHLLFIAT